MNSFTFIMFFLAVLLVLLIIHSWALLSSAKLFKIKSLDFKKSLKVVATAGLIGFVVAIFFGLLNKGLGNFAFNVGFAGVLIYLLNRHLTLHWAKLLGVFAVYVLISSVVSGVLGVATSLYVVRNYSVTGPSMAPTYNSGDYLLVNKFSKGYSRGDIVIYASNHSETRTRIVTRVIGLPGEELEIKNGQITINKRVLDESYYTGETPGDISVTLANNEYFGLGDNRLNSSDSRVYGPISETDIEGEVFLKSPAWFRFKSDTDSQL